MTDGILIVDKPQGPTSSDIVQQIKRRWRLAKVGHAGTLDPMATGVLVVCLGKATALAELLTGQDKRYAATLELGARTDSGDAEGTVVEEKPVPLLGRSEVERVLEALRGPQEQLPPMVSAVKVGGQRLYALARQGKTVERTARPIVIRELSLTTFTPPDIGFAVHCSKGTYVRVLGEDIAARLGTVGHLTSLRRTASGTFRIDDAVTLDRLWQGDLAPLPIERAVESLPQLALDAGEVRGVTYGQTPGRVFPGDAGLTALLGETGALVALADRDASGRLKLTRVLVSPPSPHHPG